MHRLLILPLLLIASLAYGQIGTNPHGMIHGNTIARGQEPMPYPFLRESDVAWQTTLWKTIDMNELFNQYMYFPIDDYDPSGKKNLIYTLWEAVEQDKIPIYEDDELLVPIDNQLFVKRYTKPDTIILEIGYDEDDNEMYETVVRPNPFDGAEVYRYSIREAWFIGKADTRQDSRRLAIAPLKRTSRRLSNGEYIDLGEAPLFWIPLLDPNVRQLLASTTAYFDDNNLVNQPSWDLVFVGQMYNAYTIRESNRYNRTIASYATGEDAILQSLAIEERVFAIGDDMWEY